METDLINQLDIQQRGSLIHYLKDNETFINVLYKEFIETPKKRDFNKYIEKVEHLTSQLKAHQEGKLRNDPIARVSFETDYHEQERIFFSKKDSEISESYLTHRLEDTLLYKTVQKIETVLQNAKKVQAPVKPQCKILINLINALDLSIRRTVANEVIKYLDETNEFIFLNTLSIKGGSLSLNEAKREEHLHSAESWELSKIEFQDFLIEYLKELPKEKQGVRVEDVEVSEKVDFRSFFLCEKPITEACIDYFKTKTPITTAQDIAVTVCALSEMGFVNLVKGQVKTVFDALNEQFCLNYTYQGYHTTYAKRELDHIVKGMIKDKRKELTKYLSNVVDNS